MPHIDSYDLLLGLILLAASYFVLGDLIDDLFRYGRKKWRHFWYGEEDLESRNVGFRLRIDRDRFRRGVVGQAPAKLLKRPGSQLNPTSADAPGAASRALRSEAPPGAESSD